MREEISMNMIRSTMMAECDNVTLNKVPFTPSALVNSNEPWCIDPQPVANDVQAPQDEDPWEAAFKKVENSGHDSLSSSSEDPDSFWPKCKYRAWL